MGLTNVLKKAFPFISAAASFGGPLGTMAAAAVGKALGADKQPSPTLDGISTAIATALGDPQQRAALIAAEQELQKQMAELGYQHAEEIEETAAADRANARNREIQVRDWTPRILAGLVVLLAACGEGWVLTHGTPAHVAGELVGRILGTLDSALMLVLAYYFGSSSGSDRKTEIMAQGAPQSK
jgi:hypothetical protein